MPTRLSPAVAALLVVACHREPIEPERPAPSDYGSPATATASPSFTAEDAAAIVPTILERMAHSDRLALRDAYLALMAHADASCPGVTVEGSGANQVNAWFIEEPCTSADGTWFSGEGYYVTFDGPGEDGGTEQGFELSYELLDITTHDGAFLRGSLSLYDATYLYGDERFDYFELSAETTADPTTAAGDPWLLGLTRGTVSLEADHTTPEIGFFGQFVTGAQDGVVAAQASELWLGQGACGPRLRGTLSLRDAAGSWHDAIYDPARSDCCGDLTFGGASLGSVCSAADALAPLLAEETP
ncbi:MAG: hypothetical protein KC731_17870 [Myxococcales bacterium]|nr:hypothetical protein [Myxococcales bacterium]